FADAPPRTSCPYKARVLRTSPFLILDVPALPRCRAALFYPHRMHRKEKLFRCERCPVRSRVRLQFAGRRGETTCKYRGRLVAAAGRTNILRLSLLVHARDTQNRLPK